MQRIDFRLYSTVLFAAVALFAVACSGSNDAGDVAQEPAPPASPPAASAPTSTPAPAATPTPIPEPTPEPTATPEPEPEPLRILVTNDDGVDSDGLDAVVRTLNGFGDFEVTVVAPAQNQSGTSDTVSDDPPAEARETTTASGYPALAVEGTPADSVNYALDFVFSEPPDFIVSGSNDGQNIGTFAEISGTVGAVRTGARRGIPGLAVSQGGVTVEATHDVGMGFLLGTLLPLLDEAGARDEPAPAWSLNTPTCETGAVRGLLELPLATEFESDEQPFTVDCTSTLEDPDDDATAFLNGYATLTQVPAELISG